MRTKTILIASDKSWIEGDAIRQLEKTAELEGILSAVGLPDLHPGKGGPVGAAFLSKKFIYPYIIGNDVGCGMGLFNTTLKARKVKRDKWVKRLRGLDEPWRGDARGWLLQNGLDLIDHAPACGTIGGGNHFAELQMVETVYDASALEAMGIDKANVLLLVHSGSRGLGNELLRRHTDKFNAGGLSEESLDAKRYLVSHDSALLWARANRLLIARRFLEALNVGYEPILDACHNSLTRMEIEGETCWLHRKGAAPSDKGPIVVPGSRGALSYLVDPVGDMKQNLWSLAHGAGRKWNRKSTRQRLKTKYSAKALTQTVLGSAVICEDRDLLYEEAPEAYKNIESVIADMLQLGLIKVLATLRPLITYKMRTEKQ
jgi:release factor H-coupled RctB family protein